MNRIDWMHDGILRYSGKCPGYNLFPEMRLHRRPTLNYIR